MRIEFDISVRSLAQFLGLSSSQVQRLVTAQNTAHFAAHFAAHLKGVKNLTVKGLDDAKGDTLRHTLGDTLGDTSLPFPDNPISLLSQEKNIIIDNNKKEVKETQSEPLRMKRPTLEDVETYVKEKGYTFDPVAFWNFYEANGWKQGNKPIKKWQCCCVTWQQREKKEVQTRPQQPQRPQPTVILQDYTGGITHEQYIEQQRKAKAAASVGAEILARRLRNN